MAASPASVTNIALEYIASQARVTSLTDGSVAANAAQVVYAPVVQLMLRELDPDFARFTAPLAISAAATPIIPWSYEYVYPADAARIRQVRPPMGGYDTNNPQPVRANVAFDNIGGPPAVQTKVILTNQVGALAVYTSLSVGEALWDGVFTDAVARRLANPLAMALSGRPDFAKEVLEEAARVASTCETVDESSVRRLM